MAIEVQVSRTRLDVVIANKGAERLRVWDRSNSWGWETLGLDIAGSPLSADCYTLSVKPRSFTRNGPGSIEIPVGGTHTITVAARYPEWDGIERVAHLRYAALLVRAKLNIPPSAEAKTYGVFIGEVKSSWRESPPPHLWLFSDQQ